MQTTILKITDFFLYKIFAIMLSRINKNTWTLSKGLDVKIGILEFISNLNPIFYSVNLNNVLKIYEIIRSYYYCVKNYLEERKSEKKDVRKHIANAKLHQNNHGK